MGELTDALRLTELEAERERKGYLPRQEWHELQRLRYNARQKERQKERDTKRRRDENVIIDALLAGEKWGVM
jgi:hypothetical protein